MNKRLLISAIIFSISCLGACGSKSSNQPSIPIANPTEAELHNDLPKETTTLAAVGLDPAALNNEVSPCDNFYEFACGGWLSSNEIPADKARYGRFTQIYERNETTLHSILEEARSGSLQGAVAQKVGAYYGACMDEDGIEKIGTQAIAPLLKMVSKVRNVKSLDAAIAELHKNSISVLFRFGATPDYIDATRIIGEMGQGGLGLPDRDYYLKDDERSTKIRTDYQGHVAAMLSLGGMSKAAAKQGAAEVMDIETKLAKVSMKRELRRDPANTYHKIDLEGVQKLVRTFSWKKYFTTLGIPETHDITLDSEEFFGSLDALREGVKAKAWRAYLTWHILNSTASALPKRFVEQNFKFSQTLTGSKELAPRWKRCVASTDGALGELVGQPYVERMFTPAAKEGADAMVSGITTAFGKTLTSITWMSQETKAKAFAKLATISPMFGYPDKWKTYDWTVLPNNHSANVIHSGSYEKARELSKIGKAYDRSEWFMSPQTTNAYYNPQANQMVFPAGILQPPFFSEKAHVPVNLGAMGMIVGHELSHGFDDTGAKFDSEGNMKNWWAEADSKKFEAKGECVVAQYSNYEPLEGIKVNGKLTLGENIADMGGVKLAYMAYHEMLANADKELIADGYTEDQQFFLAVGQAWCSKSRDAITRQLIVTDPHSPANFRVIGALSNSPEFAKAWSCKAGDAMVPANSCSVW